MEEKLKSTKPKSKKTKQKKHRTKIIKQPVKFPICTFHASYGMTINIGNYESVKIDLGLTRRIEGEPTEEELKSMISETKKQVKEELSVEVMEVKNKVRNRKAGVSNENGNKE